MEASFDTVLAPWIDTEEPINAWDAFILGQVSQHYAFSGMMAIRAASNLRIPAFDNRVFEIYPLSLTVGEMALIKDLE